MNNQKIVHVGDESYLVTAFLTSKGLRIKSRIIKYFGASLTEAFSGDAEDDSTIISVIAGLFDQITEEQFVELTKDILSNVTKNNQMIDFEREFSKNYVNLYKLIKEVLEFNYSDLFSLLGINAD